MRRLLSPLLLTAALPLAGLNAATAQETAPHEGRGATAVIVDGAQQAIGKASFTDGPNGVLVRLELHDLPPGWHGLHLHMVGTCDDAGFKASGGHVNHDGKQHGLMNPQGPDDGDFNSIYVNADGTAQAELFNWRVALEEGETGRTNLLDADGTALIIHANADDQISQPIGGAGDRIACGVLVLDE